MMKQWLTPPDPEALEALEAVKAALSEGFCPTCRSRLQPRKPTPAGGTSGFCLQCQVLWSINDDWLQIDKGLTRAIVRHMAEMRPEWAELLGDVE